MITRSLTRLALAGGTLALSFGAATGIASANPDLGPFINTTCTYGQVIAALNAQDPAAAAEFNASPMAQGFLQSFLSAPPDKRQRLALQVQAMPQAQQYLGTMSQVAGTCNNY